MFFVHLHKLCSHDDDNLILLIKSGNVHKERMLSPTIINTFKKYQEEKGQEVETE